MGSKTREVVTFGLVFVVTFVAVQIVLLMVRVYMSTL